MFDTNEPSSMTEDLGKRLRALRLQRNITQADLAARAGVSRSTLIALEVRGRGTLDTLVRVMYALGREGEVASLLPPDPPSTLDEFVTPHKRQRARP